MFLLAKDHAFESVGLTVEKVTREGLSKDERVFRHSLVLHRVLQAFDQDPNSRTAYDIGMDVLPKLVALATSIRKN